MTNKNASAQDLSIKHLSLFQNGIAFFQKNGEVDASTRQVKFDGLPVSTPVQEQDSSGYDRSDDDNFVLFGSVWFSSPANPLLRTTVFNEEEETQVTASTLTEILQNNPDKAILFTLKNDPASYSGKIVSLTGGILLIKMDKGWKQVALEALDELDFAEDPNLFRKNVAQKTMLQLDFAQAQKSVPIDLMYFQKGIGWLPTYHVQLLENNQARLRLKANLFNEVEDLHGVTINFVLGIPSFINVQEPLFSNQSLGRFLHHLANPPSFRSNDYTHSVVVRERAGLNYSRQEDDQEASASGGLSDEDLFAYQAENLSLPKGGRMSIQLLETDISYEDVYSVRLNKDLRDLGRSNKKTVNTVWHSLKFKNASGVPLPTGAISFVKDENGFKQLISQNKLDFVPAGLLARVKMTQVPDAFVFDYERLSEFEENTKQRWKLAAIEATIEAGNFRKQAITLEVEREIAGELLESDYPWTTSEPEVKQPGIKNQSREVRWVFTLQPGEQKKITYSYTMYLS